MSTSDPSLEAILKNDARINVQSDQHPEYDSGVDTIPRYNCPKYLMPNLSHGKVLNKWSHYLD